MSAGWTNGSTRRWRRTRALVLDRDDWTCQLRLPAWGPGPDQRCQTRADCVHHTQGRTTTGDNPRYLVAACTPCNLQAGDPTTDTEPAPQPRTRW